MPLQVLLVEDSPGDMRLTQEAFRDVNPFIQVHVADDGVEAMAFLRRDGAYVRAPRPDLILLDLNLPKMDGREVLAHIKEDDSLKTIPTVILTSSAGGSGRCEKLSAPGELLPQQAHAFRGVPQPGEKHQRFLADQGQVAAAEVSTHGAAGEQARGMRGNHESALEETECPLRFSWSKTVPAMSG